MDSDRYARQARFAPLGASGQRALESGRAVVVGCGALGTAVADLLARAGIRALRLIDRDVVELGNLHRQTLFDENDAALALPKAVAAASHLGCVRRDLEIEPIVEDLHGGNASMLLAGADVVLDGTDNFEARHVLNEACLDSGTPWVHGACLGAQALAWPILPGRTACYACAVRDAPPPGEVPTCETEGIIGPAVHAAAAVQAGEAIKILAGRLDDLLAGPWSADLWRGTSARVRVAREPDCPACGLGLRRFLGRSRAGTVVTCGRGSVQLPAVGRPPDLAALAQRLSAAAEVRSNAFLLRFSAGDGEITVFRDGRILVSGTRDIARARALVAQHLGA